MFGEPKTERSRREVMLSQMAIDALRHHRVNQLQEKTAAGSEWKDFDLLSSNKKPLDAGPRVVTIDSKSASRIRA